MACNSVVTRHFLIIYLLIQTYFTSSKSTIIHYQCVSTRCWAHVARIKISIDNQHVTKPTQKSILASYRQIKRSTVTQIALKNFAWNIAYPYNMSGDTTAAFVFNTFNEWFTNTTIATIKKTLRTTNGRHKIEIDEKILSKYLGDNAK